jgi:hypothetical protein
LTLPYKSHSQSAPPTAQHYNPIIPDMIADPGIIKLNGVYYCYATTDGYGKGLAKSGPPVVWQSKDFVNWSFKGIFRVSCYFVKPAAGHAYRLESSTDGQHWTKCGGHDDIRVQSPHTDDLFL